MILLIDGYNVLKKVKRTPHITPNERTAFIKELNRYAQARTLTLVIVFDGGPLTMPTREKISSYTTVIYAGLQQSADDYIKEYIEEHAHEDLMLISSDRELRNFARTFSIFSLDSYEFLQFLHDMKSPESPTNAHLKNQAHKIALTEHEELDLLMKQINTTKAKKEREENTQPSKQKSLSKKEKKLCRS